MTSARDSDELDNDNPLDSVIGNALLARESVKAGARCSRCWQETKVRSNKAIIVLKSLRALPESSNRIWYSSEGT